MRKLLSKTVAERAKPQAKPYQIHDTAIPGFVLRVQPTGVKIWKLIQNRKPQTLGQLPVTTFGMAKAKAERILRGEDGVREHLTFDQFLEKNYKVFVRVNHSNSKDTIRRLEQFDLGEKLLDEIKLADIETWRLKRQQAGKAPTTINRDTATLSSALSKAIEWDLLEKHPMAKMKRLKVDKKKTQRYLSPDEEKRLYVALSTRDTKKRTERDSANQWRKERGRDPLPSIGDYYDNLTPMAILALHTGLRRGELWNLVWGDVDLKQKMLTVHGKGAKSGQTRHMPLNVSARDVVKKHRGGTLPLANKPVFGRAEFRKAWNGVLKDAGITDFRFHDLRHTFASKLVMAGVPLNTTRELMGHASLEMTLIYAHLAQDNLLDAVDLINGGNSCE
jgi:integrase